MTMKKNKPMRAASVLLVLVLISTSFFCGVLAKYVITDNGFDTARVAKFGVVTAVEGNLFGDTYSKGDSTQTAGVIQAWSTNSQESATAGTQGTNIVAPGTKNEKGMTISISGTPEVSTRIIIDNPEGDGTNGTNDADFANTDIFLKSGTYSLMAELNAADVTITADNMGDYLKFPGAGCTYTKNIS